MNDARIAVETGVDGVWVVPNSPFDLTWPNPTALATSLWVPRPISRSIRMAKTWPIFGEQR